MKNPATYLDHLAKRGIRPSLERIRAALHRAGRPDRRYGVVLVGGTNGKGTCAKALSEILLAHGRRVGLYTSPHLRSFRERYEIDGRSVGAAEFSREVASQRALLSEMRVRLTEFEFLTFLAYRLFAKHEVAWAVMEVGMGGRWDATNAADPRLSILTTIGLDHMEFLGRTVEKIAWDKAHIARRARPLLVGPVPTAARLAIRRVAATCRARPVFLSTRRIHSGRLPAEIYGSDLALALLAARKILKSDFRPAVARAGLRRASLPGRFEWRRSVLLDVAHNEQALGALFAYLRKKFPERPLAVLLGMQRQKRGEERILPHLGCGDSVRLIRLAHARSKPMRLWRPFLRLARARGIDVHPPAPMKRAWSAAMRRLPENGRMVVTGSFITVREALPLCG
ncbi:MAG: hypothetical protein A3G34_13955 [Candidatus Lindowbacteria bacterium RIFCSPLOWO2_12_FULL_62_27]|nr:MAG: hypothetical protein A3I06_04100 [Candidatus Lindowbacteria bacterium RIFCSPLOWO2_02_FULL_62_12]OGH62673.1 MAG: hypothetical protein A3G34_13955 [Candidatus Lindowbacteria bacterium RIFCSPLOWO2_12_FULL_62_27]